MSTQKRPFPQNGENDSIHHSLGSLGSRYPNQRCRSKTTGGKTIPGTRLTQEDSRESRVLPDSSPMPHLRESTTFKTDQQGEIHPRPINHSLYMMPETNELVLVHHIISNNAISYHIMSFMSFHFQPKTPIHSIRGKRQVHHWGLLGQDIQINDTDPRHQAVKIYLVLDPLNRRTGEGLGYCSAAPHAPPTNINDLQDRPRGKPSSTN